MTQDAIVYKCLPNGMAEVVVTRTTACGSNCGNCESCIFQSELKTLAKNSIAARPGQKVIIESKSSKIYKAAMLVYILPMLLMVLGYALGAAFSAGEGLGIALGFVGLIAGAALIVLSERRKNKEPITFEIVEFNS